MLSRLPRDTDRIQQHIGETNRLIERFVLVTVFPAGMLFLLHHIISWSLGLNQYGASWDTGRFWILLFLYSEAILAALIGGAVLLIRAWGEFLTRMGEHPIIVSCCWIFTIVLAFAPPASTFLIPVQAAGYNTAIGETSNLIVGGPEDNAKDTQDFARMIKVLATDDFLPIRNNVDLPLCTGAAGRSEYKAMTLLVAAILHCGGDPNELARAIVTEELGPGPTNLGCNRDVVKVLTPLREFFDEHQRNKERFWKWESGVDDALVVEKLILAVKNAIQKTPQ